MMMMVRMMMIMVMVIMMIYGTQIIICAAKGMHVKRYN